MACESPFAGPAGALHCDWLAPAVFAGSCAAVSMRLLGALARLVGLGLPRPTPAETAGVRRSWHEIARQPAFVAAPANSALGYAVMYS